MNKAETNSLLASLIAAAFVGGDRDIERICPCPKCRKLREEGNDRTQNKRSPLEELFASRSDDQPRKITIKKSTLDLAQECLDVMTDDDGELRSTAAKLLAAMIDKYRPYTNPLKSEAVKAEAMTLQETSDIPTREVFILSTAPALLSEDKSTPGMPLDVRVANAVEAAGRIYDQTMNGNAAEPIKPIIKGTPASVDPASAKLQKFAADLLDADEWDADNTITLDREEYEVNSTEADCFDDLARLLGADCAIKDGSLVFTRK